MLYICLCVLVQVPSGDWIYWYNYWRPFSADQTDARFAVS